MGTDYTARAIIGCPVKNPLKLLWSQATRRRCDHTVPKDAKYCPLCGANTQEQKVWIRKYGNEDYDAEEVYTELFEITYDCAITDDVYITSDYRNAWAGLISTDKELISSGRCSSEGTVIGKGELADLYQQTKAALEPLGLWDEETFGLYAVLVVDA